MKKKEFDIYLPCLFIVYLKEKLNNCLFPLRKLWSKVEKRGTAYLNIRKDIYLLCIYLEKRALFLKRVWGVGGGGGSFAPNKEIL